MDELTVFPSMVTTTIPLPHVLIIFRDSWDRMLQTPKSLLLVSCGLVEYSDKGAITLSFDHESYARVAHIVRGFRNGGVSFAYLFNGEV